MLNRWARYLPIIDFLKATKPEEILEVGSGSYGLAEFCQRKIVGCDICFPGAAAPNLIPLLGSCFALPFPENAFDLVVSMDMLEHLLRKDRPKAIEEFIRVSSKHIVMGFPSGKRARAWDFRLLRCCNGFGWDVPDWLIEHSRIEFPDEKEISRLLDKLGARYVVRRNENIVVHFLIMVGEMTRFTRGIFRVLIGHRKIGSHVLRCLTFGKAYRTIFFISKQTPTPWAKEGDSSFHSERDPSSGLS